MVASLDGRTGTPVDDAGAITAGIRRGAAPWVSEATVGLTRAAAISESRPVLGAPPRAGVLMPVDRAIKTSAAAALP